VSTLVPRQKRVADQKKTPQALELPRPFTLATDPSRWGFVREDQDGVLESVCDRHLTVWEDLCVEDAGERVGRIGLRDLSSQGALG
jgi:hypothetical protein